MTDAGATSRLASLTERMQAHGYAGIAAAPGPSWCTLPKLLDDTAALQRAVALHGRARGFTPDTLDMGVAAGLLLKAMLGAPISTMIAGWTLDRWVPDLTVDNLAAAVGDDGTPQCAPLVTRELPASPAVDALVDAIDDLAARSIDALRRAVRVGSRVLWGNVALQTRTPFQVLFGLAGVRADRDYTEVAACYDRVRPLVTDIATRDDEGRPFHVARRRTCCLLYKVPGKSYCSTCNLIPEAEGTRLLVEREVARRRA